MLVIMMKIILLFALIVVVSARNKVLLVSMDGFRWDYIDRVKTPNFDRMAREGVKAPFINNTFITKTFPCHYSIATGLLYFYLPYSNRQWGTGPSFDYEGVQAGIPKKTFTQFTKRATIGPQAKRHGVSLAGR